jgi:hypothetical protein
MKKTNFILFSLILVFVVSMIFNGCTTDKNPVQPQQNEEALSLIIPEALPMEIPEGYFNNSADEKTGVKINKTLWNWTVHDSMMYICAKQWGLSDDRAEYMAGAAHMPDVYDNEGTIPLTQQWRHGWVQLINGVWIWGSADDCCDDNIRGEGYNDKSAFYYYDEGNRLWGDWYLGYASHYLQDVGNPWHTSANIVQQLSTHSGYETWVDNNWNEGHNFYEAVSEDWHYYAVSDPAASTRSLAIWSNSKNSVVYDSYVDSGNPTEAGEGNSTLVDETKLLIRDTGRYTKGLIKFTLDSKNVW